MFDLEKSIAEWRGQMLAAGLKTPTPLEELEIHLREEIAQQTKSGVKEPEAFTFAMRKICQPSLLNREFAKTGGFHDFLSRRRTLKITLSVNRLLGLLWLVYFLNRFGRPSPLLGQSLFAFLFAHASNGQALLVLLIVSAALVGGVLLVFDFRWGRSLIRTIALIWLFVWLIQDSLSAYAFSIPFQSYLAARSISFVFMLVSILVLHLPARANLKTMVKF